jgi:outer membrane protein OmpA-like peptidoglycan-associated protein
VRVSIAVVTLGLLAAGVAHAQGEKGKIIDLQGKVIDLRERVEPLGLDVKETAEDIRIELAADVLFDFDKADIRPEAVEALTRVADVIRGHAGQGVSIVGHTDAKGTASYNQTLSQRRAASVRDWLVKHGGLTGAAFQVSGEGAGRPVAPNAKPDGSDNPAGRQKNRRVEITVRKK